MQFITLTDEQQVTEIAVGTDYQVILKHNPTCSISQGVMERLKEEKTVNSFDSVYVVDVLADKAVSQMVTGRFGIPHQSPQVLVIKNGRCVYHDWGYTISANNIQIAFIN